MTPPLRLLLRTAWFQVERAETPRVVLVRRSAERFDTLAACEHAHLALLDAVLRLPEPRGALLMDIREAVGRNDPEFERIIERVGARLFAACSPVVMLVRTEIGRLHIQRFHRQRGTSPPEIFVSEWEAWAHLRGVR
ncbi:MAG: hypothetical protein MUF64_14645 [Polyangiaceae bacterium]|jgi:hypothetical protein|nr:hypothetical protein [Polyangiaceae bacterium]